MWTMYKEMRMPVRVTFAYVYPMSEQVFLQSYGREEEGVPRLLYAIFFVGPSVSKYDVRVVISGKEAGGKGGTVLR